MPHVPPRLLCACGVRPDGAGLVHTGLGHGRRHATAVPSASPSVSEAESPQREVGSIFTAHVCCRGRVCVATSGLHGPWVQLALQAQIAPGQWEPRPRSPQCRGAAARASIASCRPQLPGGDEEECTGGGSGRGRGHWQERCGQWSGQSWQGPGPKHSRCGPSNGHRVAAKGPCLPGWQKGLRGASRPLGLGRGPRAGRSPYIEVGSVAGFPSVKPATNEWINKQGLSTRQKVVRMTRNRMNREDRVLGERPGPKGHVV